MNREQTRRAILGAIVAGGVGGIGLSPSVRNYLDGFAPMSGRVWDSVDRSLPESVSSPHGPADLYRDDYGIPHVEADSEEAAYYAVGYVQSVDRIFGMDLQRRIMRGTLAEVVGERMAEDDVFNRKMDFVSAAEATRDALEGSPVEPIGEAYAAGVNAAIDDVPLPIEFELLDYEPSEWTLVDSLLMEKNISWNLSGNFGDLTRPQRAAALGSDLIDEIDPPVIDHDSPIIRDSASGDVGGVEFAETQEEPVNPALAEWLSQFEPPRGFGSNSWVVSGDHTSTGRPIVANDPHLLLMAPALWYEQHVQTPEASVRGFTFPGVPFVIIGANEHGSWGFTNAGVDVVDLYTYEFDAYNERYRYRGEWEEIETRTEEVEVADGENRSVEVRKTVHGPLIEREDEQIGVAWTGFTASRTVEAVHGFAHSENADEFLDSLEDFDLPPQSLVYADDEEAIYHLTGKLPIRRTPDGEAVPGNTVFDGSEPEAEWEGYTPFGESSWDGFIPFDEKPHVHDADYIATANQRIADDPSYYLGTSYMGPERGKRIYDVLDEAAANDDPMDIPFHEDLQTDVRDERAARVVDDIVAAVEAEGGSGATADAADLLAGWDYRMVRDSEAALIFAIWMDHFATEVVTDQYEEAGLDVSKPIDWVVLNLPPDSGFFENRSRDATIVAALEAALSEIDEAGWSTYGDWNTTRGVTHPFGQQVPFLNYPVLPADGSRGTVNNFRVEQPGQDFAAGTSLRMIDQPGGGSSAILPGGNSGDYFSDHYQDQFDEFLAGEYRSMDRSIDGDLVTTFEEEA